MLLSLVLARALIPQRLLALKGLLFRVVGTTGLLRESVDVLPINPNEDGGPAISDLVIA